MRWNSSDIKVDL